MLGFWENFKNVGFGQISVVWSLVPVGPVTLTPRGQGEGRREGSGGSGGLEWLRGRSGGRGGRGNILVASRRRFGENKKF